MKYKFRFYNTWNYRRDVIHILAWMRMGNIFGIAILNFIFAVERVVNLSEEDN